MKRLIFGVTKRLNLIHDLSTVIYQPSTGPPQTHSCISLVCYLLQSIQEANVTVSLSRLLFWLL